jgi:EAL domain-containing protein (putative c-di-GMP-specific phosphodiesterase class I)
MRIDPVQGYIFSAALPFEQIRNFEPESGTMKKDESSKERVSVA